MCEANLWQNKFIGHQSYCVIASMFIFPRLVVQNIVVYFFRSPQILGWLTNILRHLNKIIGSDEFLIQSNHKNYKLKIGVKFGLQIQAVELGSKFVKHFKFGTDLLANHFGISDKIWPHCVKFGPA